MNKRISRGLCVRVLAGLTLAGTSLVAAQAADWSDTALSWRYGTNFAEPYVGTGIGKNIYALTHVSGYKYGTNFFNVDMLESDSKDPGNGTTSGAQEVYVVYRNYIDFGKVSGKEIKFTGVRGVGLTVGFDYNSKNDAGYDSKKRMLVVGPTLQFDVPGHAEASIVLLDESNAPQGDTCSCRYTYTVHPALMADWGIPILGGALAYEGFLNYIASKGTNEFGGPTASEINWDSEVMWDAGAQMGMGKNTFRIGGEYQYWKNKFGNPSDVPGSKASTPMVRVEYHF